jgi:GrpB-like predicted nucleotidyltransferase (UPF0157 family)
VARLHQTLGGRSGGPLTRRSYTTPRDTTRGRDTTERTHLVHVVAFLGDEWRSSLALRDALRTDKGLRTAYVAEKERAALAAPEGRARYNELKQPFLDRVKASLL